MSSLFRYDKLLHYTFFWYFSRRSAGGYPKILFMEQKFPLSGGQRNVRTRQITAAILMSLAILWSNLLSPLLRGYLLGYTYDFHSYSIYGVCSVMLSSFLWVEAFVLLFPIVSNRPTKIALWIGILNSLWLTLFYAIPVIISKPIPLSAEKAFCISYDLISCYWFSVILRNNHLTKISVSWIGIWIIQFMIDPMYYFTNIWLNESVPPVASMFYTIFFGVVINVFFFISFFKFTHCTAFSGVPDSSSIREKAYSPLNKYVLGPFVVSGIVISALWAYYKYAAHLLETFFM